MSNERVVTVVFRLDTHAHPNADNIDVDLTVARRAVPSDSDIAEAVTERLGEIYPTDDAWPFVPKDVWVDVTEERD